MVNRNIKKSELVGLKNLRSFINMSLPQKSKESKIMRFEELTDGVIYELYDINNGELNDLVNDLIKTHDPKIRKEILEDILLALDDIKDITPEKFNHFEDGLRKYISEQ